MTSSSSLATFDKPEARESTSAEFVVLGITIVLGAVSWFMYEILLDSLFLSDGLSLRFVALTTLVFLVYLSMVIVLLIFSTPKVVYVGSAVLAATPVFLFGSTHLFVSLVIGIVYMLALISATEAIHRSYKNQISYFLPSIIRVGLSVLLLFMIVFVSLLHYTVVAQKQDAAVSIESTLIRYTVSGVNVFMGQFEGYRPDMPLDAFILLAASQGIIGSTEQLQSEFSEVFGGAIDIESIANSVITEQQQAVRQEFLTSLGIAGKGIGGKTSIAEVWAIYAKTKADSILEPYRRFLPIIISLGVFLTLLFVSKLLKALVYLFTWIIIHVLKLSGILVYREQQLTVRRLQY